MPADQPPSEATRSGAKSVEPLPFPVAFAFIGSGCLLVLELVAGRILAPVVGVSLYTWTSVIGVVLAGLSLGNWLGGKVADRRPGRSTLSLLYLLSALASALILAFASDLEAVAAPRDLSTILEVVWITTVVFFLPSVLLGMPLPMIVKLVLHSLDTTGRVVGRIQAAGSIGSIVGVFGTGFFLIEAFGTRAIIAGVAATLGLLAILSNPLIPSPPRLRDAIGRRSAVTTLALVILAATLGLVLR